MDFKSNQKDYVLNLQSFSVPEAPKMELLVRLTQAYSAWKIDVNTGITECMQKTIYLIWDPRASNNRTLLDLLKKMPRIIVLTIIVYNNN